eukprot:GHVQ01041449.1.p1 GENE.GHVQ01041449.1~~GHVQ01041449.1.p1  ORF type:complete len:853 (+),score=119.40 GHVQ01041449.1:123-2681(+)
MEDYIYGNEDCEDDSQRDCLDSFLELDEYSSSSDIESKSTGSAKRYIVDPDVRVDSSDHDSAPSSSSDEAETDQTVATNSHTAYTHHPSAIPIHTRSALHDGDAQLTVAPHSYQTVASTTEVSSPSQESQNLTVVSPTVSGSPSVKTRSPRRHKDAMFDLAQVPFKCLRTEVLHAWDKFPTLPYIDTSTFDLTEHPPSSLGMTKYVIREGDDWGDRVALLDKGGTLPYRTKLYIHWKIFLEDGKLMRRFWHDAAPIDTAEPPCSEHLTDNCAAPTSPSSSSIACLTSKQTNLSAPPTAVTGGSSNLSVGVTSSVEVRTTKPYDPFCSVREPLGYGLKLFDSDDFIPGIHEALRYFKDGEIAFAEIGYLWGFGQNVVSIHNDKSRTIGTPRLWALLRVNKVEFTMERRLDVVKNDPIAEAIMHMQMGRDLSRQGKWNQSIKRFNGCIATTRKPFLIKNSKRSHNRLRAQGSNTMSVASTGDNHHQADLTGIPGGLGEKAALCASGGTTDNDRTVAGGGGISADSVCDAGCVSQVMEKIAVLEQRGIHRTSTERQEASQQQAQRMHRGEPHSSQEQQLAHCFTATQSLNASSPRTCGEAPLLKLLLSQIRLRAFKAKLVAMYKADKTAGIIQAVADELLTEINAASKILPCQMSTADRRFVSEFISGEAGKCKSTTCRSKRCSKHFLSCIGVVEYHDNRDVPFVTESTELAGSAGCDSSRCCRDCATQDKKKEDSVTDDITPIECISDPSLPSSLCAVAQKSLFAVCFQEMYETAQYYKGCSYESRGLYKQATAEFQNVLAMWDMHRTSGGSGQWKDRKMLLHHLKFCKSNFLLGTGSLWEKMGKSLRREISGS